jgi:hypothetical protein
VTQNIQVILASFSVAFVLTLFTVFPTILFAQTELEDSQPTVTQTASTTIVAPVGYSVEQLSSPSDVIAGDFVIGPGRTELTLKPGESETIEIIVSNRTGVDKEFKFEVEDVAGSSDASKAIVLLGSDTGPYTLKDYVKLPMVTVDLKHNERARIPVTISVPLDASPGGRYGTLLVTTVTKDAIKGAGAGAAPASVIVSRLGSHIFLTIPGDILIEGQLQSVKTIPDKSFFSSGPILFQVLFENKGNLHLNPYGEIRITNILGEEVGFVELDPWFALPRSVRAREIEWNREFLIGRYQATAHINRGYDDIIDTQTLYFWVLPWKVIGAVFIVLFAVFFCIRFFAKNFEFKRKST